MDLENRIARLELRAEQLGIHLQDLPRNGREATQVRSELYGMLQEVAELKTEQAKAPRAARIGRSLVAAAG